MEKSMDCRSKMRQQWRNFQCEQRNEWTPESGSLGISLRVSLELDPTR